MPATYEPIATYTISGTSTNTVSFISIPATYTDLRITALYKDTTSSGQNTGMRFNSDTGTNYSSTTLQGNGTTASSVRLTNWDSILINNYNGTGSSSTYLEFNTIDIFSYTGSTFKTALLNQNFDRNGSGDVSSRVGSWRNTAAITRIDLKIDVTNFGSGSVFTLYGIKAA